MVRLQVHELEMHLSHSLERVEEGETILLYRNNRPVAEIRPVATRRTKPSRVLAP